jgi:N-acetylneuraminic acid mutarotase
MFTHRSASKVKVNISSTTKTHLIRGAFYLLLLSAGTLLAFFRPQSSGNIPEGGPPCTDDTWTATSITNAPAARYWHTAVWTGSEMIVWGGCLDDFCSNVSNTGGRYTPSTNSWTATSTSNAPAARATHTAVWTGSEMIVWGGGGNGISLNTGGRYNPSTDSWTPISTINAPTGRNYHTALWNGSEMIVWGGYGSNGYLNSGGRYNPSTDTWTPISTTNAPSARDNHTAVWTGSEMIVWGGYIGSFQYVNSGGRYDPGTDSWTATNTTNAPTGRGSHTAVWIGGEMIVWGGAFDDGSHYLNTGGRYIPGADSWTATSTTNVPAARAYHTLVWTGSQMIVWGGEGESGLLNTGGRYNPSTDSWTATGTTGAPAARDQHTAVWTGSEMIVWGGYNFPAGDLNSGGRYCAQSGASTPTPTPNGCSVVSTSPACGSVVMGSAPTYFTVQLSDAVDHATLQASDFMVNGTPADSVIVIAGDHVIFFHFNTSPALQGQNTMHIPACAFNCGNGCVQEFTCTFTYQPSTPTPTPTLTPRPSPTPRVAPTPRVRPTPPPRP